MKKIPVVFNLDERIFIPLVVFISSMIRHSKESTYYDIYILCNEKGFTKQKREELISLFNGRKITITFVDVTIDLSYIHRVNRFTESSYYRLFAYKILPYIDKILYLDVDAVCQIDFSDLFDIDLGTNYIAGVKSCYDLRTCAHKNELGADSLTYVNAGVMLLNLKQMRDGLFEQQVERCMKTIYPDLDQDIINICSKDKTLNLPLKYNYTSDLYKAARESNFSFVNVINEVQIIEADKSAFIHYSGAKPWNGNCLRDDIWWEEYRNCPIYNDDYYYKKATEKKGLDTYAIKDLITYTILRIKDRVRTKVLKLKN